VFVDRPRLFTSLGRTLTGDGGAGLAEVTHPAGPRLLWTCIAAVEVLVLLTCTVAFTWAMGRWGPRRLHGVATPAQAEALLGRTRLRAHARIIRPDLYGPAKEHRR
jgi:hypothetical protein